MATEAKYNTEQPQLGMAGKWLAGLSDRAMERFGVRRVTRWMLIFKPQLPRWYITPLTTKQESAGFQNREEFLVADKLVMMKNLHLNISHWAVEGKLTSEEWQLFLDVITNRVSADDGLVWPQSRLWDALSRRSDLKWWFLEAVLNSPDIDEDEKIRMVSYMAKGEPVGEIWHEGGKLLQWIMSQDRKKEYLQNFTGHVIIGMAKQMSTPQTWLPLMGELIKLNPLATMRGIAYFTEKRGPADMFAWLDGVDIGGRRVEMPQARMNDFIGANRQMFTPWLADKGLSKDARLQVVRWLLELEKMEVRSLAFERELASKALAPIPAPSGAERGAAVKEAAKRRLI